MLDHRQSCGVVTNPRRTGFKWIYSTGVRVFLHRPQRVIEEPALPKLSRFPVPPVDKNHGTQFHGFHHLRDSQGISRVEDGVPMVRKKNPGAQQESMPEARRSEGSRKKLEIRLAEFRPRL